MLEVKTGERVCEKQRGDRQDGSVCSRGVDDTVSLSRTQQ